MNIAIKILQEKDKASDEVSLNNEALLGAFKTDFGYPVKKVGNRLLMYEQDLPMKITNEQYNKWFDTSDVVDGVRMGEVFIAP